MSRLVSPLNPFFVLKKSHVAEGFHIEEYLAVEDDGSMQWVADPYRAMLFMSLHSADMVAQSEGGDIVAITNQGLYEEYRK